MLVLKLPVLICVCSKFGFLRIFCPPGMPRRLAVGFQVGYTTCTIILSGLIASHEGPVELCKIASLSISVADHVLLCGSYLLVRLKKSLREDIEKTIHLKPRQNFILCAVGWACTVISLCLYIECNNFILSLGVSITGYH